MRTERIVVLVSAEEKGQLKKLASARAQSLGDYMRTAVLSPAETAAISPDQQKALEEAAKRAATALKRGNEALDRAFAEIAATRAHFSKAQGVAAPKRRRKTRG